MKYHTKMREKNVSESEFVEAIVKAINESAIGLRGRKREEHLAEARKWWINKMIEIGKNKK